MTIYERIRQRRKELSLSADEVAKALNVSRATIYRYESSDIEKLPLNILEPLAKVLKTTPAYLMGWDEDVKPEQTIRLKIEWGDDTNTQLNGQEKEQLVENIVDTLTDTIEKLYPPIEHIVNNSDGGIAITIPIYENAKYPLRPEDIKDFLPIPLSNVYKDCFALRILDDSMVPRLSSGDLLIIKQEVDLNPDDIVAICIGEESMMARQIKKYENGIYFVSINPSIAPLFYTADELVDLQITLAGKVIESRSYWS